MAHPSTAEAYFEKPDDCEEPGHPGYLVLREVRLRGFPRKEATQVARVALSAAMDELKDVMEWMTEQGSQAGCLKFIDYEDVDPDAEFEKFYLMVAFPTPEAAFAFKMRWM